MMNSLEAGGLPLSAGLAVLDERINSYEMMRGLCWGGKLWDDGVVQVFNRIRDRIVHLHQCILRAEHPSSELAQRFKSDANLCVRSLEKPGGSSSLAESIKLMRQDVDAKMNGGSIDLSLLVPTQPEEELVQHVAQRIKFLNSVRVLCAYDPESTQSYADHQIKYDATRDELVPYSTSWKSLFGPPPLSVTIPRVDACIRQLIEESQQLTSIRADVLATEATEVDFLMYSLRGVQRMCSTYMLHWVTNEPWLTMMKLAEVAAVKAGDEKLSQQIVAVTSKQLDTFHAGLGDLYLLSREAKGIMESGQTPQ